MAGIASKPMRTLALATIVLLASCGRADFSEGPDRGGHALRLSADGEILADGQSAADPNPAPAGPGEKVIVLGAGEQLWEVADDYQTPLFGLIQRNDLRRRPNAGDQIIVPDRAPVSQVAPGADYQALPAAE